MTEASPLRRATRNAPCVICGNTDWCSTNEEIAICMKVQAGSIKATRNHGWLHILKERSSPTRRRGVRSLTLAMPTNPGECAELCDRYVSAAWPTVIDGLALSLGVSAGSLLRLRVGWAFDIINRRGDRHQIFDAADVMRSCGNRGWSFPMVDHRGTVTGIRIRMEDAQKFSVSGGREGLFVPSEMTVNGSRLLVAEGPTDTAALLDLGFNIVGRPSCTGGASHLVQFVLAHRPSEVVIVADGDDPGRRGAESLACSLLPYVASVRVIEPPAGTKDPRAWKAAGATAADVHAVIDSADVRMIAVRGKVTNAA